jgi:glycosyltransferase involved in cell wall biosynthesis
VLEQVRRLMPSSCRILIPSGVRDWVINLSEAYQRLGYDVTVGRQNFELESSHPDIVHFQWPEEMTDWRVPMPKQTDDIVRRLDRWATRARLILTVHNLYPHGHHGNAAYHRLFNAFYERAEVIHHFGETSKRMVCEAFPEIADRHHVVRLGFNYDRLLPAVRQSRAASRRELGFESDEMVYLVFGSLRSWDEVQLVKQAFSLANVPRKRLLMAARYNEAVSPWTQRRRRWRWKMWQRTHFVKTITDYVPDEDVYRLFDAADAVIIVRQNSMGSGIPSLTMTFGRMAIAPDSGIIPEYLAGAENVLYDGTSANSLARAMERAAAVDRESVGAKNRAIAAKWDWDSILQTCLDELAPPANSSLLASR